jgi:hypothetical protein
VALALDASSPARVAGTANPVTTAAFSPPAGTLLFALCGGDQSNTYVVSGGGLTWQQLVFRNVGGGTDASAAVWWAYNPNAQTNITVSSTKTGNFTANSLRVLVFTGAETTAGGATVTGAALTVSVTTTRANSWVWCDYVDESSTGATTAAAGCTFQDVSTGFGGISGGTIRATATTPAAGTAVTIGTTNAPTPTMVAFEVREPAAAVGPPPPPAFAPGLFRSPGPTLAAQAWVGDRNISIPPYPIITGRTQGLSDVAQTPQVPTLPAGIVPGELLVVCLANDNANTVPSTTSTGWLLLATQAQGTTTNHTGSIFYKFATGNDTLSVDLGGAGGPQEATWTSYRIANAGTPVAAGANGAAAVSLTAPTLGPTLGNYLSILAVMTDSSAGLTQAVTFPAGYNDPVGLNPGVTTSAATFSADQTLLATSAIAPGTVGLGLSEQWVAFTLAIPAANAPTLPTPGTILNIGPGGTQNHFKVQVAPVGAPNQVDHEQAEIASGYSEDPYFVTTPDSARVQFYARLDGPLSSGAAGGSRSELRECDAAGNDAAWDALLGRHVYQFTTRGIHFPPVNPACVLTQLHDGGNGDRISIRTALSGATPRLLVRINGTSSGLPGLVDPYVPGTDFTVKLVVDGGGFVDVYYNDLVTPVISHVGPLVSTAPSGTATWYWKTGVYNQSSTDVSTEYSEAEVTAVSYSHSPTATFVKTGTGAPTGAAGGAQTITVAGVVSTKAGTGAAVGAGGAAKSVTHPKTGTGAAVGTPTGAKSVTAQRTSTGAAVGAPGGAKSVTRVKAGTGAPTAAPGGAKQVGTGVAGVIGVTYRMRAPAGVDGTPLDTVTFETGGLAVTATGATRPTVLASGLNGRPAIRFDGVDDALAGVLPVGVPAPATVAIVYRPNAGPVQRNVIGTFGSGQGIEILDWGSGWGGAWGDAWGAGAHTPLLWAGTALTSTTNVATSNPVGRIIAAVNGASSSIFVDEDAGRTGDPGGGSLIAGHTLRLGNHPSTANRAFSGDLYEIIVFDHALTAGERTSLFAYFATTYIAAPIVKTGAGAAAGAPGGAKSVTTQRTSTAAVVGAPGGAKSVTTQHASTAAAVGAPGGAKSVTRVKAGTGVTVGAGAGAKQVTTQRTTAGVAVGAPRGPKTVTTQRTSAGVAVGAPGGAKSVTTQRTSTGTAVGAPTGAKTVLSSQVTSVKTGAGAAVGAPGGAKTVLSPQVTSVKAGSGVSVAAGGGAKVRVSPQVTFTKAGTGAAVGVPGAAKSVTRVKAGLGATAGVGAGAKTVTGATTYAKTATGAAVGAGSGTKTLTSPQTVYTKAGLGAVSLVGAGVKTLTSPQVTTSKAGTGVVAAAGAGAKQLGGATSYSKTATGVAVGAGRGVQAVAHPQVTTSKAGTGVAVGAGAGAKQVGGATTVSKAGTGAAVGAGRGVQAVSSPQVTSTKTATGAAGLVGAGAKTVTHPKAGTATVAPAGAGAKTVTGATTFSKTGAGAASGVGRGTQAVAHPQVVSAKAATGAAGLVGAGGKTIQSAGQVSKAGTGTAAATGAGAKTLTSPQIVYTRASTAAAVGVGRGVQAVQHPVTSVKAGTGAAPLGAGGIKAVEHTKGGLGALSGVGSGAKTVAQATTYVKTATAAATGTAAGGKAVQSAGVVSKSGGAVAEAVAAGPRSMVRVKTARGVLVAVGAGAKVRELAAKTAGGTGVTVGAGAKVRELAVKPGGGATGAVAAGSRVRVLQRRSTAAAASTAAGTRLRIYQRPVTAAAVGVGTGGTDRGPRAHRGVFGDTTRPSSGRIPRGPGGLTTRPGPDRVPRVPAGATGRPSGSF